MEKDRENGKQGNAGNPTSGCKKAVVMKETGRLIQS